MLKHLSVPTEFKACGDLNIQQKCFTNYLVRQYQIDMSWSLRLLRIPKLFGKMLIYNYMLNM